ncbi:MAG: head maturation protease [Wendovervirus sonii]|uniref:endopeptidase Clp n=1 Tax=phage Lak_Megaphage_Sonny TaxID=3109229 RepID=A0ABZ0Z3X9_9CAUD|nr:MAG: head maturation protease [phage Lak_Megaphage_Sonny]
MNTTDFTKFATSKCNVSKSVLEDYGKVIAPKAGYINPMILEERNLNVTSLDIMSRLMMDRIIMLNTEIDSVVSGIFNAQLLYLNSNNPEADIKVYIDTPGGSVYAGLSMYDTMQYISNPISTVCTGMAASMGSIILCAGEKGQRYALPHSRVMIHQPMGGMYGQASDMEIEYKEINKLKDELYQIISKHSGQTIKKVYKDADRDFWMTSKEALEYGMIDNIFEKQ